MPEYFYHIGIELFSKSPINSSQAYRSLSKMRSSSTSYLANEGLPSSSEDSRIDDVVVEEIDDISAGIGTNLAGINTKAAFISAEESTFGEQGIVHLYRDAQETPGLYQKDGGISNIDLWNGSAAAKPLHSASKNKPPRNEDCTLLSILAVPSYLTPKDFLAYIGPDTRSAVSHFRMIRTSRLNRYMVLMKFKDGRFARQWQHDWNGKVFNSMEPETCHVVFVKSVEVLRNQELGSATVTASTSGTSTRDPTLRTSVNATNKPVAPPTPALVELPTCPVCLERMDESTGLLTILCQHVFHCTCLEKWSGGGCPVCRYSHDDFSTSSSRVPKKKFHAARGEYEIDDEDPNLECAECRITQSLWQCLICGYVGCGRYAGKHAYTHYERTSHTFSLDLETQRVWDYDRDVYVHRIIANASGNGAGEKLIELPGRRREGQVTALEDADRDLDIMKRENLAFEYTQLLTSQLESQRIYFEELVAKAADKATEASRRAEKAAEQASESMAQLTDIMSRVETLRQTNEALEKEKARIQTKANKLEHSSKELSVKYEEQKMLADALSKNVKLKEISFEHEIKTGIAKLTQELQDTQDESATKSLLLEEAQQEARDLRAQLDAKEQIQRMIASGQLTQEDLEGATIEFRPGTVGQNRNVNVGSAKVIEPPSASMSKKSAAEMELEGIFKVPADYKIVDGLPSGRVLETLRNANLLVKKDGKEQMVFGTEMDEVVKALLDQGCIEKKAEEGLYGSDDESLEEGEIASGAKGKKKKSGKKKSKKGKKK